METKKYLEQINYENSTHQKLWNATKTVVGTQNPMTIFPNSKEGRNNKMNPPKVEVNKTNS